MKYRNDLFKAFDTEAQIFPYQDISLYETVPPNRYDYSEQIRILLEKPDIVLVPVKALPEKFPAEAFFRENVINIKTGDEIDVKDFAQKLVNLGYKRSTMVSDIGEFSIRGDIIDVFSLDKNALRIELWGDEVVDLRYFNNETQKSVEKVKNAKIFPLYKFIIPQDTSLIFAENPELNEQLAEEKYFEGIDIYQNYFQKSFYSVTDYLKDYVIIFDESSEIYSRYENLDENYKKQIEENLKLGMNIDLKGLNHITCDEFIQKISSNFKINLNNFLDSEFDEIIEFESQPVQNFSANPDEIAEYIKSKRGYKMVISTDYPERVKEFLAERDIFDIEFIQSIASSGSILEDFKTIILTDRELFNRRSKEVTSSKRSYYKEKQEYIESINDIKEGEYVVHSIHGVGIYKGLSQQEIDGQLKDYLTIEYANKDKLHIPAEQINLLVRYRGSGSVKPKLSRMGGKDWDNTKARVKKEVEQVAYDLLRLYAKRKMQTGIQFLPDTTWQVEMEEAFEYTETPDQMKAINEVKSDMESIQPMDRLICGDVGFGKTEVALRAIFKAVTSGKQAAVIVPTTILALQHFQTIFERFKPFGIDVELMSRFRSTKEQKETVKKLASGKCDVVVPFV